MDTANALAHLRELAPFHAVVSDVDGVLTDGRLGVDEDGRESRCFHTHDGMGVHLLHAAGLKVGWLSAGRDTGVIRARAERLGVDAVDVGQGDKGERFASMCRELGVDPVRVVYVGDDVNDLPAMELAGATMAPPNAVEAVRGRVDIVLSVPGGEGAFRQAADLVIAAMI